MAVSGMEFSTRDAEQSELKEFVERNGEGFKVAGGGASAAVSGVLTALKAETAVVSASGEAAAALGGEAALLAVNTAAKAVSVAGGAVTLGFSVYDTSQAVKELREGDPAEQLCNLHDERVSALAAKYSQEPTSVARRRVLAEFTVIQDKIDKLREALRLHHTGANGSRIGSNALQLGSGVCFLAAPFTLGATAAAGAVLAGLSTAVTGGVAVGRSINGFSDRQAMQEILQEVYDAQLQYAIATQRLTTGVAGRPGRFCFSVPGTKWCQIYMTLEFTTPDRYRFKKVSCDQGLYNWYGDTMTVEPCATDVVVSFDVRGGCQVCAVDHEQADRPWIFNACGKRVREEFHFPRADGVDAQFELAGTSLHCFVQNVIRKDSDFP